MRLQLLKICALITLLSCKSKKESLSYETNIASLIYSSELNYLNNTLRDYSHLSDIGAYYLKQDSILETKASVIKKIFKSEKKISIQEQREFLNFFETSFKDNPGLLDSIKLDQLKSTPITEYSDIELLTLLIKRSFVSKLVANKYFPFDMVGTMVTVDSWSIQNGEEFKMQMNITAASSTSPAEWYIIKDGSRSLIKENIIDTLYPDEFGSVNFKTKKYHKGTNQINVATKFKLAHGDKILYKGIEYTVH